MDDSHVNSYYALVWNTTLETGMELRGAKITRSTRLPKDSRMLYGTNRNDVSRIRKVKHWQEIEYDPLTTQQSIKFWNEIDEYDITRDIYIVVWEGKRRLDLSCDHYKIVSPEVFEYMIEMAFEDGEPEQAWINPVEEIISQDTHDLRCAIQRLEKQDNYCTNRDGKLKVQSVSY